MDSRHPLWTNLNRLVIVTALLFAIRLFTYFVRDFLPVFGATAQKLLVAFLPFLLALVLAFLLEPVVLAIMRTLRIRRPYASLLTLVAALAVIALFVFLLVARLYTELSELANSVPSYSYVLDIVTRQIDSIERFVKVNPQVQNALYSSTASLVRTMQDWAKSGSLALLGFLAALPGVFIIMVVSVVATLLTSASFPRVKRFLAGLFPKRWHQSAQAVSQNLGSALIGFLRAEIMLVSVTAVTTMVGLAIIGNRYAVLLGVLAGILDLVPVVGTGMLFIPWIVALLLWGSLSTGLKVLVMWVITVVLRQFLEPKIMSKNLGLDPLPTLVSMYVGLQLFGGIGLILGPTLVIFYGALRKTGVLK
ncbi:AI-2 transport protein TqsA [Peptococcaceae bacterium CEB3]|nr:AI-2 transport protein TqsA [Peptococcaceae bacterium CEB3]